MSERGGGGGLQKAFITVKKLLPFGLTDSASLINYKHKTYRNITSFLHEEFPKDHNRHQHRLLPSSIRFGPKRIKQPAFLLETLSCFILKPYYMIRGDKVGMKWTLLYLKEKERETTVQKKKKKK